MSQPEQPPVKAGGGRGEDKGQATTHGSSLQRCLPLCRRGVQHSLCPAIPAADNKVTVRIVSNS